MQTIRIHPSDNVVVALEDIAQGSHITAGNKDITITEPVRRGHKIAICDIMKGEPVVKYGNSIAVAVDDIKAGSWVHTHNVKTQLKEDGEYDDLNF